jgi:hypothetical protein
MASSSGKVILPLLLLSLSPVTRAQEKELPVAVVDSGSKVVDELVAGLVSHRPAPWPTGVDGPPSESEWAPAFSGRYATEEVKMAIIQLQKLGPSAFPHLLKHLDDDRYSYSDEPLISGVNGGGWMNHSVGEAVYLVLTNDLSWVGGYKIRDGADGKSVMPLTIGDFIDTRGGLEAWVETVKDRSRIEVFTEFIEWCVAEEKKRGFASNEEEERVLSNCRKKLEKIEEGSGKE